MKQHGGADRTGTRRSPIKGSVGLALAAVLLAGSTVVAQEASPLMSARQVNELFTRSLQLMEATTVALPEMNRAGAPLMENARQALINLRQRANNSQYTYSFLTNLRAFVMLADSVNRPFPFSKEAETQLAELREAAARTDIHFRALLGQRETQLRSPDRDNLARYADANLRLSQPSEAKPRVVFLGDSITDGWRLNEYFPDHDFINRGIGGQVTGEMLGRFKADVIDLKPKAVLILAGTNDLARGVNILAIENNFSVMADLAEKHDIKLILASVLPVSDYHKGQNPAWEQTSVRPPMLIRALNDWLRSFCSQRGFTYLDYYSAMVDASGQLGSDLADDGLHPNAKGYRIMAPLALAAIEKAAGTAAQQKPKRRRLSLKD
jgi:lysophospholipase L1-like esterase